METLNSGIPISTDSDYNQEFREELTKQVSEGEPPYLLYVAKKIAGEELLRAEGDILKSLKVPGVQVAEDEKKQLKQLLKDLYPVALQTAVKKMQGVVNQSATESEIQPAISNAIKTSTLPEATPHLEVVNQPAEEYIPSLVSQANIETLKQYLDLGIKLIPVYDNGAFIKKGSQRDFGTDDIGEIQSLINGNGYRNGLGRGRRIKIFRFFPIDYGLVVVDIDRHVSEDGELKNNGLKKWVKIEAELNLPMDCRVKSHTCYVRTPSSGYHLYFRLEGKVALKTEIAEAIDILHTKTVNVAGSVKEEKEYKLIESLATIPTLSDELKKLMLKPTRIEPQQIRRVGIPQNFSNGSKYLSEEELAAYKPFLIEYLVAKGFQINAKGLTNCPFPEHHNNGDKNPSAQANKDFLYCFTARRGYDIWAIAKQFNSGNFRAACADVVNTLRRR